MTASKFLTELLAVGAMASPISGTAPQTSDGAKPAATATEKSADPKSLAKIFEGMDLTDQYGQTFKPAELFKNKPCIVLFGYEGCPRCQVISESVAAVQQKLIAEKQNVPIIVVSVQPEEDRKDDKLKPYVEMYYQHGVRQFANEALPEDTAKRAELGAAAYDAGKKKPKEELAKDQQTRLFHIVCPPTAEDSKKLQTRISEALTAAGSKIMLITAKDPKQHTAFMTVFNNGQAVDAYRALNDKQEAPPVYTSTLATDISRKIADLLGKNR